MKRFVLSGILIASFVIFSLYYRFTGQSTSLSPTNTGGTPSSPSAASGQTVPYKDGTYVGDVADALYGNIQVQAIIQSGKITDVQFLQYPSDRSRSVNINQYAMPLLKSEAIQSQAAQVDIVSGATDSSQAFIQSLGSALHKAM